MGKDADAKTYATAAAIVLVIAVVVASLVATVRNGKKPAHLDRRRASIGAGREAVVVHQPSSTGGIKFVHILVLFVLTLILLAYIRRNSSEVELVRSSVDGRTYLVRRLANKQQAADILARLNERLIRLTRHMMAKYGQTDARAAFLYRNYDPENTSEGGVEHGYTSYSVNKGEKLVMCVRQSDTSFVDENVLTYVAVHELAHLMTKSVGHTEDFWENFKFLLREAIALGVYARVDFGQHPADYCGIKIRSSVI